MSTGDNRAVGSGGWELRTAVVGLVAGAVILILGVAFVTYSFTLKEWCEAHANSWRGQQWGEMDFNEKLGACIRQKSWLSF